jgi:environmental stress-induced protein Ves
MKSNIYSLNDFKTKQWSGGNTTELYIFPPTADFGKGNFDFRISTATVEVEKSNFTALPNVSRHLMVLEGEITIAHKNHHSVHLTTNDIDSFKGDWETTSIGTCVDFNLMTTENTKGNLSSISINSNKRIQSSLVSTNEFYIYYVAQGTLEFDLNSEVKKLNQGELLVIHNPEDVVIEFRSSKNCSLVQVNIPY